jgi:hypothetical protein
MSNGARIAIAIIGLFFGAMFALVALSSSGSWLDWLLTVFCLMLSVSCIGGKIGAVAQRGVAACIFAACVCYLILEALKGDMGTGRRSEASLSNAITAFIVLGLPFGCLAVFGTDRVLGWFERHSNGAQSASRPEQGGDEHRETDQDSLNGDEHHI